jgi:hypothetical protein
MYDLSIHDDTGRGHHPVAHDLRHVGDLFQLDLYPGLLGSDTDELGGCIAVFAPRTQHLDIFHSDYLLKIVSITSTGTEAATGVFTFQLLRRTGYRAIRTEHAAIALQRLEQFPTTLALVIPLASVGWHGLFSDMTALGAGDRGLQNDYHGIARCFLARGKTL